MTKNQKSNAKLPEPEKVDREALTKARDEMLALRAVRAFATEQAKVAGKTRDDVIKQHDDATVRYKTMKAAAQTST